MAEVLKVGDLFSREPVQWGLRGDPQVWAAMRQELADVPVPADRSDLRSLLYATFRDVVGLDLDDPAARETIYLAEFDRGGMSAGTVHLPTWRDRLIPILIDRSQLP